MNEHCQNLTFHPPPIFKINMWFVFEKGSSKGLVFDDFGSINLSPQFKDTDVNK